MSQKKRVRVYQPDQMGNPLNSWFMQMGGIPQQQDMSAQVMQYAQQMIIEGEDPNNVYDDLVNQGVPSQLAAQVIEQLMEAMPPQPAYSQPSQEEAMYNQEVEEAEEAVPDYLSLTGFDEDDEDDDFKKGGMTKNKFIKEYKKLKLGGQKPDEIPGIQSAGFLGTVQNEANNYKIQKEAEEMYNNPFAVNALSQFVYGGSLPKAQDAGGAGNITEEFRKYKEENEKYRKEQEERYKQLEQRYNQGYNQGYRNDPYLYGNPYGRGYGNVPIMFNPYGRRGPIIQKSPYLNNFPGADFQGMQLSNFKIEPHNVERLKPFRFLGPKTKYTWSGEWTRNPQTGATTPAAGTTSTTTPAASTTTNTNNTVATPVAGVTTTATTTPSTTLNVPTPDNTAANVGTTSLNENANTSVNPTSSTNNVVTAATPNTNITAPRASINNNQSSNSDLTPALNNSQNRGAYNYLENIRSNPELLRNYAEKQRASRAFMNAYMNPLKGIQNLYQQGGYLPKAQVGFPPEIMPRPFDQSPYQQRYQEQMDAHPFYRDYINKIKAGEDVSDEERARAEFLFDQTLEPMDQEMMGDYNEFMKTPGELNLDSTKRKDGIKNAYTIDIPAAWDTAMYGARSITGALDDNRMRRDSLANFMGMVTNGEEEFGQRGNYTINQSANSSNFRPDLDGQIQYSQYGGQFELGEETEMTDEEIEKFLKGGGKLRFV